MPEKNKKKRNKWTPSYTGRYQSSSLSNSCPVRQPAGFILPCRTGGIKQSFFEVTDRSNDHQTLNIYIYIYINSHNLFFSIHHPHFPARAKFAYCWPLSTLPLTHILHVNVNLPNIRQFRFFLFPFFKKKRFFFIYRLPLTWPHDRGQ